MPITCISSRHILTKQIKLFYSLYIDIETGHNILWGFGVHLGTYAGKKIGKSP